MSELKRNKCKKWWGHKMKIITVNLPENYIKTIDRMIGDDASYPSRSELVRVAVRDFLIRELDAAQTMLKPAQTIPEIMMPEKTVSNVVDDQMYVHVPMSSDNGQMMFKTFRVVKK